MRHALHPKLAKRYVWNNPKTGRSKIFEYSASCLIRDTQGGFGDRKAHVKKTPLDQCQRDILMIDRYNDMGIAKTEAIWGIDYIHLVKFNGEWKIINVLWQTKDGSQAQKEDTRLKAATIDSSTMP